MLYSMILVCAHVCHVHSHYNYKRLVVCETLSAKFSNVFVTESISSPHGIQSLVLIIDAERQ